LACVNLFIVYCHLHLYPTRTTISLGFDNKGALCRPDPLKPCCSSPSWQAWRLDWTWRRVFTFTGVNNLLPGVPGVGEQLHYPGFIADCDGEIDMRIDWLQLIIGFVFAVIVPWRQGVFEA